MTQFDSNVFYFIPQYSPFFVMFNIAKRHIMLSECKHSLANNLVGAAFIKK